ncbi:AmmeMemoRadiSam system protein A [candidate division FCPU426 bacterium]|nr:AmmeMemoRadiSam system protein A [candidate division FCPU426 bacterium]
MVLTAQEKQALLQLARAALLAAVRRQSLPDAGATTPGCEQLQQLRGGAFVTLTKKKMLRGCIGLIESEGPLTETVVHMAAAAALEDPRFSPVQEQEVDDIGIEISVLTPLRQVSSDKDIVLGRDGVLIRRGRCSGVFLPQVAKETGWDLNTFLYELCVHKAGLPPRAWEEPGTVMCRFEAEVFKEQNT